MKTTDRSSCNHAEAKIVKIGFSMKAESLLYEMDACTKCGTYIDTRGNLSVFEKQVSEVLGREWRWLEERMSDEEFESWDYNKNIRVVTIS
jgi:hypothetical protein